MFFCGASTEGRLPLSQVGEIMVEITGWADSEGPLGSFLGTLDSR